jgi:malate dehydrogenase
MLSFATTTRTTLQATVRSASLSSIRNMSTKVTVLGASGGIGQPLSMLLKLSPYITELACYDIANTPGVAADLSHVSVVIWFVELLHVTCYTF